MNNNTNIINYETNTDFPGNLTEIYYGKVVSRNEFLKYVSDTEENNSKEYFLETGEWLQDDFNELLPKIITSTELLDNYKLYDNEGFLINYDDNDNDDDNSNNSDYNNCKSILIGFKLLSITLPFVSSSHKNPMTNKSDNKYINITPCQTIKTLTSNIKKEVETILGDACDFYTFKKYNPW
jgi:hypothetical protein